MKIVLIGSGQVGQALATALVEEAQDLTVIDPDEERLRQLQNHVDLRVILGSGSNPQMLEAAGCQQADMLIAVSHYDEVNILSALFAKHIYEVPTTIARVHQPYFWRNRQLFQQQSHLTIDYVISPEQLLTEQLVVSLHQPGGMRRVSFADGRLDLGLWRVPWGHPWQGQSISEVISSGQWPQCIGLCRHFDQWLPLQEPLKAGDQLLFLAPVAIFQKWLAQYFQTKRQTRRIVIAGSQELSLVLAEALSDTFQVTLVEENAHLANQAAKRLPKACVLHGRPMERKVLLEAGISSADVFCALTENQEYNIALSLLARALGAQQISALVGHMDYLSVVEGYGVDWGVSMHQVIANAALRYIRRGDVIEVFDLLPIQGEVLEAIIHGAHSESRVVGRTIQSIKWPDAIELVAVYRNKDILFPDLDLILLDQDHLIFLVKKKTQLKLLERLLQVHVSYFSN